ncbi:hypothetical protein IWX90DRAFT_262459 [Phyllosticta citrichinensis]|uniref:Uncharacterized protein n=1 Tax=Phyllosticta citrichinensis TaxID=1130410 RepID=A0ABR1XSC9_9PEZI
MSPAVGMAFADPGDVHPPHPLHSDCSFVPRRSWLLWLFGVLCLTFFSLANSTLSFHFVSSAWLSLVDRPPNQRRPRTCPGPVSPTVPRAETHARQQGHAASNQRESPIQLFLYLVRLSAQTTMTPRPERGGAIGDDGVLLRRLRFVVHYRRCARSRLI